MITIAPLLLIFITMGIGSASVALSAFYIIYNVKSEDETKKLKLHSPLIVTINVSLFLTAMLLWVCSASFKGSGISFASAMCDIFFGCWLLIFAGCIAAIIYLRTKKSVFWDVSRSSVKKLINISALGAFLCKLVGALS